MVGRLGVELVPGGGAVGGRAPPLAVPGARTDLSGHRLRETPL